MKWNFILLIAVTWWTSTPAHVIPAKRIHETKVFKCIANEKEHRRVSDVTKAYLCLMVRETNIQFITITSSCGRKSFHHGIDCLAIDFFPNNYTGKDLDDAQLYEDYLFAMATFLDEHPWLASIVGFGIYVSGCGVDGDSFRGKFIFHFDVRGTKARWGQIGRGKYVSIEEALESHWKVVDGRCGE